MEAHGIGAIDLVVVNLYPFEATIAKGASYDETIENIDIGGPAMIRSAAKNHAYVDGGRRSGRLRHGARGRCGSRAACLCAAPEARGESLCPHRGRMTR